MNCKHLLFSLMLLFLAPAVLRAQFPCLNGMSLSGPSGQDAIDLCQDGFSSTLHFAANISALPVGYLVVGQNDEIVYIGLSGTIDFSGLPGNSFTVYAFNFIGSIRAEVGDPFGTPLTNGCYALTANAISVTGDAPTAGMVSTEDGETEAYTCPGDGLADIVRFDSTDASPGASYVYLVTDENNIITEVINGDNADFETDSVGVSRVWGLAYNGNLTAMAGDTATSSSLADGCYSLSDNFVTVFRQEPVGGTVSTEDGADMATLCSGAGTTNVIRFDSMGVGNSAYTYVVTDTNNVILFFTTSDQIDFDTTSTGVCRVWGLAYTGGIIASPGDTASITALSDGCFSLSDNYVTINKDGANGGDISTDTGEMEVFTCPDSLLSDTLFFSASGATGNSFAFLLTDTSNIILSFPDTSFLLTDSLSEGIYRVWGLAYNGLLAAMAGDTATSTTLSDDCFALSNNFLTIYNTQPSGGMVSTENGETEVFTCPGDGIADIIPFDSSGVIGANYTYIVTDTNNVILSLPAADEADFDNAGVGTSRVWGLAYSGGLTAMVGDTASTALFSDGCFSLSGNYITVNRQVPDGAMVSTGNGDSEAFVCPGDGTADVVNFSNSGSGATPYAYVVTDTNNVILALPASGQYDFDPSPLGICRVWGLAYTGTLTAMVGDTASTSTLSDECFSLSSNFITIFKEQPLGGQVSTEGGQTALALCVGDGLADVVRFDSTGTGNSSYAYVVTDTSNVILAFPSGDSFDFEGAGSGTCYVWGLAFTGTLTAQVGDTASVASLADGCFALSDNFIVVVRESVDGGMVMTESGETQVFLCPGNGIPDTIRFDSSGVGAGQYAYIITDTNNVVLSLPASDFADFEGAAPGISRVWGLAYTDSLLAMVGDTASSTPLAIGCYALSDNYITVIHQQPEGGTVTTAGGATNAFTCPGDGVADIVSFDNNGGNGSGYAYIVTDTNNVVIEIASGGQADFEDDGIGVSRVWGIAYTGNLTVMVGDTAATAELSDDCYSLSMNFVTVYREIPNGGSILTESGETTVNTCTGDGMADLIRFDSLAASNSAYAYIVTDTNAVILSINTTDGIDFEGTGGGVCYVWGLAYTGNITAMPGDTASATALSDACFDLSDDFVSVIKEEVNGGMVSTEDGANKVYLCPGDGLADTVRFDSSGILGEFFTYLVTDTNNVILSILTTDFEDFEDDSIGVSRVWGLAYSDSLIAVVGDTALSGTLATGCHTLSSNFITIYRDIPDGGTLSTVDGSGQITACTGSNLADAIRFDSMDVVNSLFAYIVTDTNDVILYAPNTDLSGFNGAGLGLIRIWGMAYTGEITAMTGDTLPQAILTDECYDLTDNFITVSQEETEAGIIRTTNEESVAYTCPGDGVPDVISFENYGAFSEFYGYILSDTSNVLIGFNETNLFNFDGLESGIYYVWGLAYSGTFTASMGDSIFWVSLTDGCHALSDNFVTVNIDVPNGGMVSTESGDTQVNVTVGDGLNDWVDFDSTGVSNSLYVYIITDTSDVVEAILNSGRFNFENSGAGTCRVWGLAYTGALTFMEGDTISILDSLSTDCYSLSSNFVTVNRQQGPGQALRGGVIPTEATAGSLQIAAWPVPVDGLLTVRIAYEGEEQEGGLRLLDHSGRALFRQQVILQNGTNQIELDTKGLLPGLYLIHIRLNDRQESLRFIKQ